MPAEWLRTLWSPPWSGNFDKAADPRSTGAKTGPQRPRRRSHWPIAGSSSTRSSLALCAVAADSCCSRRRRRSGHARRPQLAAPPKIRWLWLLPQPSLNAAPVLTMSAPMETRPPACAPAARGRAHRAGVSRAQAVTRSFRRVRVPHRRHQPSLFTACAGIKACSRLSVRSTELELCRSYSAQQTISTCLCTGKSFVKQQAPHDRIHSKRACER